MTIALGATAVKNALNIPKLTHAEAGVLSRTEYERVLAVLESLDGDDWTRPTYCTEWDVHDMVAHLSGSVTGSASFAEFKKQYLTNPYLRQVDKLEDGINRLQVEERADKAGAELVAEFRHNGPIAISKRQGLPWLVRKIPLPMGTLGFSPLEYLMDTIFPRDEWMHRYDICAATGKRMVVTADHDGRLVALIVRELALRLKKEMGRRAVLLRLVGAIEGEYLFGGGATPDCTIELDVFDFNLLASGRIMADEAMDRAVISGDTAVAHWFLAHTEVPY